MRLRVERQLGYKMAKYLMRIEAVESFKNIRGGKGGYWEDLGYAWYAGIRSIVKIPTLRVAGGGRCALD